MDNNRPLIAHLCVFTACVCWGLMSPLGKDAMAHGIDSISMVSLRIIGGAILFWLASLFGPKEHVPVRDRFLFIGAGVFGLIFNQCSFTIGLGITSPVNASIVTTSMPIFAMILAALILHEPITGKKALGVLLGCCGAVMLIASSAADADGRAGNIRGDLMCVGAQLSFALYLSLYNNMSKKYSPITVSKWMFTWAAILVLPFTAGHLAAADWQSVGLTTGLETGFVVVFGTFVAYLLMMVGQHTLRPTVVSIYNYMQPVVAVTVSVLAGLGVFRWPQALAAMLVFAGVWLVTKSKSKRDMQLQQERIQLEQEKMDRRHRTKKRS